MKQLINSVRSKLESGYPILIIDDHSNATGAIMYLAEKVSEENILYLRRNAKGTMKLAITFELAEQLGLNYQGVQVIESLDVKTTSKSTPTYNQSETIEAILKAEALLSQFDYPGHVYTTQAKEHGVLEESSLKSATVDLARICGEKPAGLYCEVLNENGVLANIDELHKLASDLELETITIEQLIQYRKQSEKHVKREIEAQLPTKFGDYKIVGYSNDLDNKEHIAIVKGDLKTTESVMVRIHSECFTGDIFGSYRCDCGPQLHAALDMIEKSGSGVIVYMRQEGRGIGLLNKLRAYKLQEEGRDTHQANLDLGFKADAREYHLAIQILEDLGIESIELLTNNPDKVSAIEKSGIKVTKRIPLEPDYREENAEYMKTKKDKFGHILKLHI